ncbi:DUF1513 domain-containing protein [uncultured Pseudoteredinibacter sp.]|uniref:DUF1513 domain-containing protein n=1 Tax=uncultured Pseudoteredinibacter sp. TaxID=1641701 RepID=UPI00261934C7|nr:DUF1513 domain-containing protein [uncultured Pseudoteredinibacter sp.]
MNRREFVFAGLGLSLVGLFSCDTPLNVRTLLLSGYQDRFNKANPYGIAAAGIEGKLRFMLPLPQRIHQVLDMSPLPLDAVKPISSEARTCLAIARRPGTELYHVDVERGLLLNKIVASANRHFFGHACRNKDGKVLVPQNHLDKKAASIAVFDPADAWRLLEEIPLPGIGPHQIECLSDGKTLVVAMGGIHTQPNTGRRKLNIDTMQSSLLYIDSNDSKVLAEYYPEDPKLSLRHMAVSRDDRVIIAAQYQGPSENILPLAFSHHGEENLLAFSAAQEDWRAHQQYIGSVSVDSSGSTVYLSSPRAGIVSRWNLNSLELEESYGLRDACGLAYAKEQQAFFISNGLGQIVNVKNTAIDQVADQNMAQKQALKQSQINTTAFEKAMIWDNHLTILS